MTTPQSSHLQAVDLHPAETALAAHHAQVQELNQAYDELMRRLGRLEHKIKAVDAAHANLDTLKAQSVAERGRLLAGGEPSGTLADIEAAIVSAFAEVNAADAEAGDRPAILAGIAHLREQMVTLQTRAVDAARKLAPLLLAVAEERIAARAPSLKAALGAAVSEMAEFAALCEARDRLASDVPGSTQCGSKAIDMTVVLPRIRPLVGMPDVSAELARLVKGRAADVLTELRGR